MTERGQNNMSNSPLVSYTKISPFSTNPRKAKIDTITIHHMAGNGSVEACGAIFQRPGRDASSNYGVGSDGRIALYVDEANRAWTSGNAANDNRAVTIEVANDGGAPDWHVSDKALEATIELCVDICQRNGIASLNYTGDKSGNLTMHKWFQATSCPGPYLERKFPYIAGEVNRRLKEAAAKETTAYCVQVGAFSSQPAAEAYLAKVKAAGFNDAYITTKGKSAEPAKKSNTEIAKEVIAGKWGSGSERKRRLTQAGYDYRAVQDLVNQMMK